MIDIDINNITEIKISSIMGDPGHFFWRTLRIKCSDNSEIRIDLDAKDQESLIPIKED